MMQSFAFAYYLCVINLIKKQKKAGSNDFNIAHYNSFDYYLPIVWQSVKGDEYVFYSTAPTGFDLLGQFRFRERTLNISSIFKEKAMRIYQIWLADTLIGTTLLEKADPPMGCVHGLIIPLIDGLGYDYIKQFYASRHIGFDDESEIKGISTRATELLKVITPEGKVIESLGNQIYGMDDDAFEVSLEGVGYPFYEEEFPKHCANYENYYADWEKNRYKGTVSIYGKIFFLRNT